MNGLSIQLDSSRTAFKPGKQICGSFSLSSTDPIEEVILRLFWYTRGKGDEDIQIVSEERYSNPLPGDGKRFSFYLPKGPYSFSGKLISLIWALELIAKPSGDVERMEIVVAPEGQEIFLHSSEEVSRFDKT